MFLSTLIIEDKNGVQLQLENIKSDKFSYLYDEERVKEMLEKSDGSIISRKLDVTYLGKNMLIMLGIKEVILNYKKQQQFNKDTIIVKAKRDEYGRLWRAKLKTTSKVNELIYINNSGGRTKICFNFCPCCLIKTNYLERYPLYICMECIDIYKPKDINGKQLDIQLNEFGSVRVLCDNKLTNLKYCYINGIKCDFSEYRFGGGLVFTPLY